jgi:rhamnosyltransferase
MSTEVCAVVVAFHPDDKFESRLIDVLAQIGALVVVDNTPAAVRQRSIAMPNDGNKPAFLIENTNNLGVAAALNQGLKQALEWNCDWLLTLDQDSHCYPDMVQTLLHVHANCVPPAAVIGGNYLDTRNGKTRVTVGTDGEFLDQKTVITSGCLVDARFAQRIGGFREDYFIDQLDHEFCLRARSHGGKVVISRKPAMKHSVGEDGGVWLPPLGYLPNHSPLRKYYVARNSLVTIFTYWRREPDWCLRRLVRLVMGLLLMATLEQHRLAKVAAFFIGVADALRGRMGPCTRESINRFRTNQVMS